MEGKKLRPVNQFSDDVRNTTIQKLQNVLPEVFTEGEMNAMHSLTLELSKSYKNWNLTLGGYDLLQPNLRLIENKSEYAFFKERQYFKTGYFRLSYFFGNNKVKTISKKQDDINERIN